MYRLLVICKIQTLIYCLMETPSVLFVGGKGEEKSLHLVFPPLFFEREENFFYSVFAKLFFCTPIGYLTFFLKATCILFTFDQAFK